MSSQQEQRVLDLIRDADSGDQLAAIEEDWSDVLARARRYGGKAEIVVKVTAEVDRDGESKLLVTYKTKGPARGQRMRRLAWVDGDGRVLDDDPRQTSIPFPTPLQGGRN